MWFVSNLEVPFWFLLLLVLVGVGLSLLVITVLWKLKVIPSYHDYEEMAAFAAESQSASTAVVSALSEIEAARETARKAAKAASEPVVPPVPPKLSPGAAEAMSKRMAGVRAQYRYFSADGVKGPFDTLRALLVTLGVAERWTKDRFLQYDKLPENVKVQIKREKIV